MRERALWTWQPLRFLKQDMEGMFQWRRLDQIIDGQGGHVGQVGEVGEGQDCWQGGHNSVRWVILEGNWNFC